MRFISIYFVALCFSVCSFAGPGGGHGGGHGHSAKGTGSKSQKQRVKGYNKKNGKHVNAYSRSTGDATQTNNWSANSNVNPETGKVGTKPVKQ